VDLRWRVWVDIYLIPGASAIGIVLIAIGEVADASGRVLFLPWHPDRIGVLVIGFALTITATMVGAVRRRTNSRAANKLAALEHELGSAKTALAALSSLELADIFERLGYSTRERITLFAPSTDRSYLRIVGRWSPSDQFRTIGRAKYPLDQGCLGEAWRKAGESWVIDLPDPLGAGAAWRQQLEQQPWNIPSGVSSGFHMKSRTYIALAIIQPLRACEGVIVIESERLPSAADADPGLDPVKLRRWLKGKLRDQGRDRMKLIRILEVLASIED